GGGRSMEICADPVDLFLEVVSPVVGQCRDTQASTWQAIYIGQGDISVRCTKSPHQIECINSKGATHVHLKITRGDENTRKYQQRDLLATQPEAYAPTGCNQAFPVVPVILPETTTDPPFDFLRVLTWVDFSHVTRVFDAPDVVEQLLRAIHGQPTSAETARDAICPYRGLDAFREEDSAFFFGRGSANDAKSPIGELVCKVRDHPFVMVVGRSGSGKSS